MEHGSRSRRGDSARAAESAEDLLHRPSEATRAVQGAAADAGIKRVLRDAKRSELAARLHSWGETFKATVGQAIELSSEVVTADEMGERYVTDKDGARLEALYEKTVDLLLGELKGYLGGHLAAVGDAILGGGAMEAIGRVQGVGAKALPFLADLGPKGRPLREVMLAIQHHINITLDQGVEQMIAAAVRAAHMNPEEEAVFVDLVNKTVKGLGENADPVVVARDLIEKQFNLPAAGPAAAKNVARGILRQWLGFAGHLGTTGREQGDAAQAALKRAGTMEAELHRAAERTGLAPGIAKDEEDIRKYQGAAVDQFRRSADE